MTTQQKPIIEVYTEYTPNPESLKFVVNKVLIEDKALDYRDKSTAAASPLALQLFEKPFVNGVFVSGNFVTITKTADVEWLEVVPEVRAFLKEYLEAEKVIWDATLYQETLKAEGIERTETEQQIIDILDKYVRPAVEGDGGNIVFNSFENGRLSLTMQGSCSGCPSSTLTLKQGIEGLLKKLVPEVQEVVANMG